MNIIDIIFGWITLLFLYEIKLFIIQSIKYRKILLYESNNIILRNLEFRLKLLLFCIIINLILIIQILTIDIEKVHVIFSSITTNLFIILLVILIIKYLEAFNTTYIYVWKYYVIISSIFITIFCSFMQIFYDFFIFKVIKRCLFNVLFIITYININLILYNIRKLLIHERLSLDKININIIVFNSFFIIILLYQIITELIIISLITNIKSDLYIYPIFEFIGLILIINFIIIKKHQQQQHQHQHQHQQHQQHQITKINNEVSIINPISNSPIINSPINSPINI